MVVQAPQKARKRVKLLDACVERFPEHDARVLSSLILQGKVLVDDQPEYKAGSLVPSAAELRIRGAPCKFASRWATHMLHPIRAHVWHRQRHLDAFDAKDLLKTIQAHQ